MQTRSDYKRRGTTRTFWACLRPAKKPECSLVTTQFQPFERGLRPRWYRTNPVAVLFLRTTTKNALSGSGWIFLWRSDFFRLIPQAFIG